METQKFTLAIPYSNKSAQARAKKGGARWNGNSKVWEVETTLRKLEIRSLDEFIVDNKAEKIDMRVGFMVDNNPAEIARVNRLGYDAIEF